MTPDAATPAAGRTAEPTPRSERLLRTALVLLLLAAPLPLGCAPMTPRAILAVVCALLAIAVVARPSALRRAPRIAPGFLPFAGWLLLAAIALLPFGGHLLPAARELFGDRDGGAGSLVPMRTWVRLGELLALAAVAIAATTLVGTCRSARRGATALVGFAAAATLYGVAAQQGALPLLDAEQTRTVLVGTFVNRNHFANLLVMATLVGLGLWTALRHRQAAPARLLALAAVLGGLVLGVVATASRGALLSLAVGGFAFPLLAVRSARQATWIAVAGGLSAVAVGLWLLPATLASRFAAATGELQASGSRLDIWRGALALWRACPWFGTGLGTYGDLSPATQSAAIPGRVEHVHNELLEVLVETGALGAALALAATLTFFWVLMRRCRRQGNRERTLLAAGGLAALLASATHALVEFNLQIPATALWTAAIAGAVAGLLPPPQAVAATNAQRRSHRGLALAMPAIALLLTARHLATFGVGDGLAAIDAGRALLVSDRDAAAAAARSALAANPFSPRAHRLLGEALLGRDEVGSRAAFDASLRWTNPADRPGHRLAVAQLCIAAGDLAQAQHRLAEHLPHCSAQQLRSDLDALYTQVPSGELLAMLLPQDAAVSRSFADLMARRGDFGTREAVLARLRGAEPAMLTVADGIRLVEASVDSSDDAGELAVPVELTFARDRQVDAVPLVLRCEGPGAALFRPFDATDDRWRHTLHLGAFPPGRYDLTLDFRGGAFFPLGSVTVPPHPVDLRTGATVPADALCWTTAEPARRDRPRTGVPLRPGDELWCDALLPDAPADLVVHTDRPTQLAIAFDERSLTLDETRTTVHRVTLPGEPRLRIALQATDGAEPVVTQLFVQLRGTR